MSRHVIISQWENPDLLGRGNLLSLMMILWEGNKSLMMVLYEGNKLLMMVLYEGNKSLMMLLCGGNKSLIMVLCEGNKSLMMVLLKILTVTFNTMKRLCYDDQFNGICIQPLFFFQCNKKMKIQNHNHVYIMELNSIANYTIEPKWVATKCLNMKPLPPSGVRR